MHLYHFGQFLSNENRGTSKLRQINHLVALFDKKNSHQRNNSLILLNKKGKEGNKKL